MGASKGNLSSDSVTEGYVLVRKKPWWSKLANAAFSLMFLASLALVFVPGAGLGIWLLFIALLAASGYALVKGDNAVYEPDPRAPKRELPLPWETTAWMSMQKPGSLPFALAVTGSVLMLLVLLPFFLLGLTEERGGVPGPLVLFGACFFVFGVGAMLLPLVNVMWSVVANLLALPRTSRIRNLLWVILVGGATALCCSLAWIAFQKVGPYHSAMEGIRADSGTGNRQAADRALWQFGFAAGGAFLTFSFAVFMIRRLLVTLFQRIPHKVQGPVPSSPVGNGSVRIAHWSDLHLTSGDEAVRVESGTPGGNRALRELIAMHGSRLIEVDALLITGDITDGGTPAEWRAFHDLWSILPESIRKSTILLPGNHDINITDAAKPWRPESLGLQLRRIRLLRALSMMKLVQGDRAVILDESNRRRNLSEFLDEIAAPLQDSLERKNFHCTVRHASGERAYQRNTVDKIWEQVFPMQIPLPGGGVAYVLDSTAPGTNIITNAFGEVPRRVLERLRLFLASDDPAAPPPIIALHHHVLAPRESLKPMGIFQSLFMVLRNADELLDVAATRPGAVIFHGHRHVSHTGQAPEMAVTVIGGHSTTLGDENPEAKEKGPGFEIIELAATVNGLEARSRERVKGLIR
jgi:hypothetical protein